jgi:hypothetical protein
MYKYYCPSYATIYQGVINGKEVWRTHRPERAACYGSSWGLFKDNANNKAHYEIILITDKSWLAENYKNQCRMSKHQVENYLRRIKTIYPFKYSVKDGDYRGSKCFILNIDMVGTRKEATFILQCIKRTYEWPFSFFLEQAYKLQELPQFKYDSILNLFNVALSCFTDGVHFDHCFSGNTKFEKYSTLREKLPHVIYVSDLYPDATYQTKRAPKIDGISYYGSYPNTPDEWTNELFQELLPYYIKNYNVLKR